MSIAAPQRTFCRCTMRTPPMLSLASRLQRRQNPYFLNSSTFKGSRGSVWSLRSRGSVGVSRGPSGAQRVRRDVPSMVGRMKRIDRQTFRADLKINAGDAGDAALRAFDAAQQRLTPTGVDWTGSASRPGQNATYWPWLPVSGVTTSGRAYPPVTFRTDGEVELPLRFMESPGCEWQKKLGRSGLGRAVCGRLLLGADRAVVVVGQWGAQRRIWSRRRKKLGRGRRTRAGSVMPQRGRPTHSWRWGVRVHGGVEALAVLDGWLPGTSATGLPGHRPAAFGRGLALLPLPAAVVEREKGAGCSCRRRKVALTAVP